MHEQALRFYADGLTLRQTARTLGVNHQTIVNWVNADAAKRERIAPPLPETVETVEMDELYTFAEKKTARSS